MHDETRRLVVTIPAASPRPNRHRYGDDVSVSVTIPELFEQLDRWGWCYLLTVSDSGRPHLIALRPTVVGHGRARWIRLATAGGSACRNATHRPGVTLLFPPSERDGGFSLVVDGEATVEGDQVDVRPTGAVLHRPAP